MKKLIVEKRIKWRGANEDTLGYEQLMWRKRAVAMSRFISREDKSVMDLGAGNMCLSRLLDSDTKYLPVDYRKTSEETVVCDFNKHEFPEIQVDVIYAAGILEYIEDPEWFLTQITKKCKKLILSYRGKERFSHSSLYTDDIIHFMREAGFILAGINNDFPNDWTLIACFEKATPQMLHKNQKCTGCGACVNVCPTDALCLKYDEEGYYKPYCDTDKCIGCGKCINVCSAGKERESSENRQIETYAVWAPNDVRFISSSGGAFSVFANKILDDGGSVYGVSWDDKFIAHHERIIEKKYLNKIRYSKYSQSNTLYTFRNVMQDLENGKKVLYTGCPCQISGLKSYLKQYTVESDSLVTIDLVCFCAPSNQLFRRYLDEEYGIDAVKDVTFREKAGGWSPVGYKLDLKDGTSVYPNSNLDPYQKAFHGVLARNEVCENCEYTDFPREGDITLGDFWGIDKYDVSWNDGMGTSAVIVNSDRGNALVSQCISDGLFNRIERVPNEWIRNKGNRLGNDGRVGHQGRRYFNSLLKKECVNDSVNKAIENRFDIGLVTVFNRNIGNNLTNHALFHVLDDMGYETQLIDAPGKSDINSLFLKPWCDYRYYQRKDLSEYDELNERCHQFLVGCDQIWRSGFVKGTKYYTCLEFVSGEKYKASYATSTGVDYYEGDEKEKGLFSFFINRLQKISVRESSGAEYLGQCINRKVECVMDPVFLCSRKHYEAMAEIGKMRIPKKRYVASYILDVTKDIAQTLKYLSSRLTDETYNLILDTELHYDGCSPYELDGLKEPCVEEWVASIAYSDYFVTDSFHGMCFALIFNKPFVVLFKKNNWRGYNRIKDLLSALHLENRLIDEYSESTIDSILKSLINYSEVNSILEERVAESRKWLENTLKEGTNWNGKADIYDLSKTASKILLSDALEKRVYIEERKTRMQIYVHHLGEKLERREFSTINWRDNSLEIVAWGAGDCFLRNIHALKDVYSFKYVCDGNPEKWERTICGVKCISPKQLSQMQNVGVIIFIDDPGIAFDVASQLTSMGISKYDHITNLFRFLEGSISQ